jgi:hypothetical protein
VRRFLNPGIDKVRLVINKFVNETVVLTPENITLIIAKSWDPKPVNLVLPEKGVINVQPDIVNIELEHFAIYNFFCLNFNTFNAMFHFELTSFKLKN